MIENLRKKFFKQKTPEASLSLRYVVLAAMLIPLIALGRVNFFLWPHILVSAGVMALGHRYSYTHLKKKGRVMRGLMFIAVHMAFCWLIVGLGVGATVPQAQFAIFAQAITSFDLRYRRSLFYTLLHSLANLYIAASLSRTYELAIYLLLFVILVLAAFFIAEKEDGQKAARLQPQSAISGPSLTLFGFSFGVIALVGVFLAFIFTPRFANNPIVPPFTLNIPLDGGITSEIINPGVPLVQINGWSNEVGDYYFGFDTQLDLRYRGGLSDNIVMYVRSPSRSYWRSHSFDYYDGTRWSQSKENLREIRARGGVFFHLDKPIGSPRLTPNREQSTQRIVQSFSIVREQPNLVFAAYRPLEIFITADRISIDSGGGIRVPEPLKSGLTYSVVSERPDFDPERLRDASPNYPSQIQAQYLQLPSNISERVKRLAIDLTAAHDNPYDKVMALTDHLLSEYPYNYFPPPHPPGAEVVDTFLFEDQEGFCEQYATSLVVMARSLGIPARLVSGYGSGEFNPITNYYEVRYSDAHSWVEVYFPRYGWVPFDPTPGWNPRPYPTPVQNWLFANSGQYLGFDLSSIPLREMVTSGATGLVAMIPFLIGAILLAGLIILVLFLSKQLKAAFFSQQPQYTSLISEHPHRRLIFKLYRQAVKLLIRRKYPRREEWETLSEYAHRTGDKPGWTRLTEITEMAAYRPQTPDESWLAEAESALQQFREESAKE